MHAVSYLRKEQVPNKEPEEERAFLKVVPVIIELPYYYLRLCLVFQMTV